MKLNDIAKALGFKGAWELAEYAGISAKMLRNHKRDDYDRFITEVMGAAQKKLNEAFNRMGEERL